MSVFRRLFVVLGLAVLLAAPMAAPASADIPPIPGAATTVPTNCTVQPGGVHVLPAPAGSQHAVRVTIMGIKCVGDPWVREMTEWVELTRYWPATKTWTVDRTFDRTFVTGTNNNILAPADVLVGCSTGGAVMGARITMWFWHGEDVSAVVLFPGQGTASCSGTAMLTKLTASITLGHPDIVRAHLVSPFGNLTQAGLTLWAHNAGVTTWTKVGTARTDANGLAYLGTQPRWWTAYRWTWVGNATYAAATSPTVTT